MIDYIVVGAGTSGAVLAARLSEDPACQVLLVEAGPDYRTRSELPESLRDAYASSGLGHDWNMNAELLGRTEPLLRGKVVGGSSQVNGCGAMRPAIADFETLAKLGLPEWNWQQVLPTFCEIERDHEFGAATYHGTDGPVPIGRPHDLTPAMDAFGRACVASGHQWIDDMNAPDVTGIGPYPQNIEDGIRVSTNLAYLESIRTRPNLTIRSGVEVQRVAIEGDQVTGIHCGNEMIQDREVVLCAGSPMSPAILLRSGIGPERELRQIGIPVVIDAPLVGQQVLDQPGAVLPFVLKPTRSGLVVLRPSSVADYFRARTRICISRSSRITAKLRDRMLNWLQRSALHSLARR